MAEIVGVVASLSAPALEVGKCFKKQFNYLCCFKTNIKDLTDAAKDMEDARADLQERVNEAKRNGELILHQVETWVAKAGDTQVITLGIQTQIPGILNFKSRYSLSRKAKKTAESMNKLRDSCKFDPISQPALPASMGPTPPPRPTQEIESRKETENDIIAAMRCRDVRVIGVCGMGGIGKTTMAKRIMNRAQGEEGIFDEVVMVGVGQQVDMLKIQHGIADWLGLELKVKTLAPRAHMLRGRLMGGKRALIIIDDVWERIDLEGLGIPCESGACTILLTSRDRGVFDQMNAQRVFTIQILYEEEAWFVFKENVGACVDDLNLLPIASEVVKECKGLPLALVAVSRALKGKVSKPIWLDALKQLRSCNPMDMPYIIAEIYNPIKLSYEFLENQHAKSLLFICSLFPEDHYISLEDLAFYGVGLCLFEGINVEETRNRIAMLVEILKSRFLILDGEYEHYVKMHDVVRDVAIFIASNENHAILEFMSMDWSKQKSHCDCTILSVVPKGRKIEFSMGLTFPSLRFLWMDNSGYGQHPMSDHFFKGMQQLQVLYINSFSLASTPHSMQLLKNLHTLHLVSCTLERLSSVGELSSLEILCCLHCDSITVLPVEIGRLNRLRLLEVSDCECLKTIMPGVISRLGRLEELKMLNSFKGWESDGKRKERRNASLVELESLSNLMCLKIEIEDFTLAAQELELSSKIVKYDIQVGGKVFFPPHEKNLHLNFPMETSLGNWINVFARSAESLHLEGDDSNSLNLASAQNMRCLVFINCWTVVKLVSWASTEWRFDVFPVLETLYLEYLPKLEEICDGPILKGSISFAKLNKLRLRDLPGLMHLWRSRTQEVSLSNLCSIHISGCGNLRSLFSSSVVIKSLSQIQTLDIINCDSMEAVFSIEEENDGKSPITFPNLRRLALWKLGSLAAFCKGIDIIEFLRLDDLEILECPKLISFVASDQNNLNYLPHDSVHLFCYKKLIFGSLKKLCIRGYENISYAWCHHFPYTFFGELEELVIGNSVNIKNLFSYTIAGNLVNLKKLTIDRCSEMVYVIADDAKTSEKNPLIFHKLEHVLLLDLPKLQSFCEGRWSLQFLSLIAVDIRECLRMEGFTMGPISTPNLKEYFVDEEMKNVKDLIEYPWL